MPVKVIDYNFTFLSNLKLTGAILANAFSIENIPYQWKKENLNNGRKKKKISGCLKYFKL